MGWKLRSEEVESLTPDYGSESLLFTIRMHHSGSFVDIGEKIYKEGKISHIDSCDADELSLLELSCMASEIGLEDCICFHFSRSGVDFNVLETDGDVLNLVNMLDGNRIVDVFVEHKTLVSAPSEAVCDSSKSYVNDVVDFLNNMDSEVGNNGDSEVGNSGEGVSGSDQPWELLEEVVECNNNCSDDELSIGSDSDQSEIFIDSDNDVSDDDLLFETNIDAEVEYGADHTFKSVKESDAVPLNVVTKKPKTSHINGHPIFNPSYDMKDHMFELGMYFEDIAIFREAVRSHSIRSGRDVKFTINEKTKVQAKCKHEKCHWLIYASLDSKTNNVQVKTLYGKHTCPRLQRVSHANSKYVSSKFKDKIWSDPRWPVDSMVNILKDKCKLVFSKSQMYRAKKKVFQMGAASDSDQYGLLWSYAEEINKTNPGTTVKIKCRLEGDKSIFKRLYICWGALKRGFLEGCRRVIFLDGCHLKTAAGGVLLTVVGVDANNGIYPFAYAIVEKEKTDTWSWFIELLITDLNIENSYLWTVVSDKQKGLVDAISTLLPDSEQRFCVMHLYKNFKLQHKGLGLRNLLWKAARSTRVKDFENAMKEIKEKDVKAFEWLNSRPPCHWSKSHFRTNSNCDMLLNNMSECFNSLILRARSNPILKMLEIIRQTLMKRIHVRRDQILKHQGKLCPKIEKILEEQKVKAMSFIAHWNGQDQFEVESSYGQMYKVHLGEGTCSCRRWELSGIPCSHAISALYFLGKEPEDSVSKYYTKETFISTYSHLMGALDSADMWPIVPMVPLIPPPFEKLPGRPKKYNRRKAADEIEVPKKKQKCKGKGKGNQPLKISKKGAIMTCTKCKTTGHNASKCTSSGQHEGPSKKPRKKRSKEEAPLEITLEVPVTKQTPCSKEIVPVACPSEVPPTKPM